MQIKANKCAKAKYLCTLSTTHKDKIVNTPTILISNIKTTTTKVSNHYLQKTQNCQYHNQSIHNREARPMANKDPTLK